TSPTRPRRRRCVRTRRRRAPRSGTPARSTQSAALVVRPEEVLAAGGRHRRGGADLETERGGGHDLREAVDLAAAGAVDRGQPVARRRKGCAAADGADLEPTEADRRLQPALDLSARA